MLLESYWLHCAVMCRGRPIQCPKEALSSIQEVMIEVTQPLTSFTDSQHSRVGAGGKKKSENQGLQMNNGMKEGFSLSFLLSSAATLKSQSLPIWLPQNQVTGHYELPFCCLPLPIPVWFLLFRKPSTSSGSPVLHEHELRLPHCLGGLARSCGKHSDIFLFNVSV